MNQTGTGILIGPSILSADFARLGEQVQEAERAGADYLHVDVMDGQYVPPITFGALAVKAIRPLVRIPIDVHFMVQAPERFLEEFADAGADSLTVHVESTIHLHRTLDAIHKLDRKAGAALNPATSLTVLTECLYQLDLINVLAVNPGYSGQEFIEGVLPKISRLRHMLDALGSPILLEVDGGVNPTTAARVVAAGGRMLVAGSAVFNQRASVTENLQRLREVVEAVEVNAAGGTTPS